MKLNLKIIDFGVSSLLQQTPQSLSVVDPEIILRGGGRGGNNFFFTKYALDFTFIKKNFMKLFFLFFLYFTKFKFFKILIEI